MFPGNYELRTDWDPTHSWVWQVTACGVGCVYISAIPRPNGGAAPYYGSADLAEGQYRWDVDVHTGLVCFGHALPTHNTYTWDPASLTGSVSVAFDVGCSGEPAGSFTYSFALARL
ncbi:hypothetical protein [Mycobacterium sp. OAE908]